MNTFSQVFLNTDDQALYETDFYMMEDVLDSMNATYFKVGYLSPGNESLTSCFKQFQNANSICLDEYEYLPDGDGHARLLLNTFDSPFFVHQPAGQWKINNDLSQTTSNLLYRTPFLHALTLST